MKNLFTPSSLLMYLMTLLVFDFIGMSLAAITGAAKGQGLAGGAIVFMYGIYAAVVALVFALIFCYYADQKKVKIANRILAVMLLMLIIVTAVRFYLREESTKNTSVTDNRSNIISVNYTGKLNFKKEDPDLPIGLGFFKPDMIKNPALYFYGNPELYEPADDLTPNDSLVFKRTEITDYELVYAPPWLMPEHYKLDYDIFYLKLLSVGKDFVKVSVNDKMEMVSYLDRNAGEIIYWPEFMLRVYSVEFPDDKIQKIRIKPLDIASEINIPFEFMKPVLVQDEWMMVELVDSDFNKAGEGWIRWRKDNEILVSYSLLS